MKRFKLFVPIFLISVILISLFTPAVIKSEDISKKVFRLHIIANSDSAEDQSLKLKIRDNILKMSDGLYAGCSSVEEAEEVTRNNINRIQSVAQQTAAFYGHSESVYAYTSKEYFSTRKYDNFTLPAGEYSCLKIVIGEGKGRNWWCVMFPGVCLSGCSDELDKTLTDDEQKMIESRGYAVGFKAVEIYEYIKSKADR